MSISRCVRIERIRIFATKILSLGILLAVNSKITISEPINVNDFESLLLNDDLYIDKSMLIDEYLQFIAENHSSLIILRPEGWGKSTNLAMLEKFLEIEVDEKGDRLLDQNTTNDKLFLGNEIPLGSNNKKLHRLKIANSSNALSHLGQHPVILLRLKNAFGNTYDRIETGIKSSIVETFKTHEYLTRSTKISEKQKLENYLAGEITSFDLIGSIKFLSCKLFEHFERKVHILIDDYDIPFISAFVNYYTVNYRKVGKLLENFYETSLNENAHRSMALFAGVFPIKTNDGVYYEDEHLLRPPFGDFFGFTSDEVDDLVKKSSIETNFDELKSWYGGYYVGEKTHHFNSRSVTRFFARKCTFEYCGSAIAIDPRAMEYWFSDNSTFEIYTNYSTSIPASLAERMILLKFNDIYRMENLFLIEGHRIRSNDNLEAHSFGKIRELEYSWHSRDYIQRDILFYSGYLTTHAKGFQKGKIRYHDLTLPNKEVKYYFQAKALEWVCYSFDIDAAEFYSLVELLRTAQIMQFRDILRKILSKPKAKRVLYSGASLNLFLAFAISIKHVLSANYIVEYENDGHMKKNFVLEESFYSLKYEMDLVSKMGKGGTEIMFRYENAKCEESLNDTAKAGLQRIKTLYEGIRLQNRSHISKIIAVSVAFYYQHTEIQFEVEDDK